MPIIEQEAADATPVLPETPVPAPPQAVGPKPSFAETRDAAFAQTNILGSMLQKYTLGGYRDFPAQPGYDPYANNGAELRGYDEHLDRFSRSNSPEQTQVIKNLIDAENSNQQTLARAGAPGYVAALASGAVDPITLTSMLIPGLEGAGFSRLARIGVMVGTNVAAGEAQAYALARNSETINYTDGILPRVGVNALLAGVLGSIATRIPKAEFDKALEQTRADFASPPSESTAGAAAVRQTTLEDESLAAGGKFIGKTVGQISPLTRVMVDSPEVESRRLAQRLVDVPYILKKNEQGVATPTSVEMRINQIENMRHFQVIRTLDGQYADYARAMAKEGKDAISKGEFSAAVADAARDGDAHDIPQVAATAKFARQIFEQDKASLQKLGVLPEDFDLIGAKSYFPRVYDQHAVMHNQTDLEARLTDWFTKNPKLPKEPKVVEGEEPPLPPEPVYREPAEVRAAVRDTIDHILGTVRGTADIGTGVKTPNVLKARKLDVPDTILRPYLSSDFEHVMQSYSHTILPQIELRKEFGSADLANEFQTIKDQYHIKLEGAKSDAEKAALTEQLKADIQNLTLLRDRVLNQIGPRGNESLNMVRAASLLRSYNYVRMLGGQTLSSLSDWGRLVTRYGLMNTAYRTVQFLTGLTGGLSRADAQRMGTALDNVIHTRMHTLDGIGNELAGGDKLLAFARNQTNAFTKWSGIAAWDSMMRVLSSQMEQDAIARAILKDGGPSKWEMAKLAAHGIGEEDLPVLREQWAQHGSTELGLHRARTELWTNRTAAEKVEQAVQRAGSSNAFFVGKGDLPGFANSEWGKMVIQFKAFALSSVNRLAIPLSQGLAHGDVMAANGLAAMLALGALTYYTKELAAGRKPDLSPHTIIPNAVQRSGILTYLPDLYDPAAGMFHLPRFSKFKDLSPVETLMGPSAGTAAAMMETVNRATKGGLSASDMHKLRQLLPYQNLFYFNRLVNIVEGKTDDALNLKGAPGKPALDYLNPAEDQAPKDRPDRQHLLGIEAIPNAM